MIITRSPLRISLGGGGTDLPSYYESNEGFLIAASINKYVYLSIMAPFSKGIFLKYSQLEHVKELDEIQHDIFRECLKLDGLTTDQIEITAHADIPAGTGLGSSGSFTTALLKGLYAHNRMLIDTEQLAELACHVEIEKLKQPIGKQDQYIAAYGGLTCFNFHKDGTVNVSRPDIPTETLNDLEDNLLLFFTGFSRKASVILEDQNSRSITSDSSMQDALNHTKELGFKSLEALMSGQLGRFGEIMHEHWEYKKRRSSSISNSNINNWYDHALMNGAVGGKLVGAGGGGFLMFYADDRSKLRRAMAELNLPEVRFSFDFEGTKIL